MPRHIHKRTRRDTQRAGAGSKALWNCSCAARGAFPCITAWHQPECTRRLCRAPSHTLSYARREGKAPLLCLTLWRESMGGEGACTVGPQAKGATIMGAL